MPTRPLALLVVAKTPLPGRAKTRLSPALTPEQATEVAVACLTDTLDAVRGAEVAARVVVLDGEPWPELDGLLVLPQHGDGLDDRLAHAHADTAAATGLPVLQIGMDTPQVTPALLEQCADLLLAEGTDAVLGLAEDGGWWALGLRRADGTLLRGVPMSTPGTGAAQLGRLRSAGLRVAMLPTLRDVDLVEDLLPVAAAAGPGALSTLLAGASA